MKWDFLKFPECTRCEYRKYGNSVSCKTGNYGKYRSFLFPVDLQETLGVRETSFRKNTGNSGNSSGNSGNISGNSGNRNVIMS